MTGKRWQALGLFLAAMAAFSLACGGPRVALAANEPSVVEQALSTPQGKAALAKSGVSPEKLNAMLASLSPEQRQKLEKMAAGMTPKAVLTARLLSQGYTQGEVSERLAVLSNDEMVQLAGSPEATEGGGFVAAIAVGLALVLVAVLVAFYFCAIENPQVGPPPPMEPPPLK